MKILHEGAWVVAWTGTTITWTDRLGLMTSQITESAWPQPRLITDLMQQFNVSAQPTAKVDGAFFTGLSVSSAEIQKGEIFVAVQGLKAHGARFAQDALAAGASAVLTDAAGAQFLVAPESGVAGSEIVLVAQPGADLRELMARVATWFHNEPSATVAVAGVTGTNGKTTTTFFLDAIMRGVGQRTGLIGTIEMRLGEEHKAAVRTTVEAPVLQDFFARAVEQDIDTVSMEVSSHALSLHRVTGTKFAVVGFTNLQHDHLDFHHTMEEYYQAKAALFTPQYAAAAVINVDDKYGWRLAQETDLECVSIASQPDGPHFQEATWRVLDERVAKDGRGVDFVLAGPHGAVIPSFSPLLGSVNVANAGLATLMALQLGIAPQQITDGLKRLGVVPGRMEVVSAPHQPLTIVDYAHTTEALEFALTSLGERHIDGTGKLIVVFGAAGERDASKRPDMGRVAVQLADRVLVTDDDPYQEDRGDIRSQIIAGAQESEHYLKLSAHDRELLLQDYAVREDAITAAISMADPTDTVLIAGRGHESIQDLAGVQHELDDRVFARGVLARVFPAPEA